MATTASILDRETIRRATVKCFHCGTPCWNGVFRNGYKPFCCHGCLTVFELLSENGLGNFYQLAETAGVRVKATRADQFKYLDEPMVRERLVDYQDERVTRVTFHIPAIHCIACVWLLENLFRLKHGIGESHVNFPRKELSIGFDNSKVSLSEVVALITSLGYEPELKLSDLSAPRRAPAARRLWLQLGLAGFAFGNLMLFSIAGYFGFDAFTGPTLKKLVGYLSFALATPVVIYSALDYWRTAWTTLKQKRLAIEVPIAAGIVAIYAQSAFEVLSGRGEGYFDSLCGLIFFLLCGRLFQQKTFDRLNFERDYKSFFPLSVTRRSSRREEAHAEEFDQSLLTSAATNEEQVALAQLHVGDTLVIRNGELIPADARVLSGSACIDYSFVTGESEPIQKKSGDYLYAGGRQLGGVIEIEMVKPVSQSYLTSLWNQDAFRKDRSAGFETLINAYSYRFTLIVIAIAVGAAVFWAFHEPSKALKAFTSVLIVACPCALALAAPFTLGTAMRLLGRRNVFVKNTEVIEALANVDTIVFDKTGTLTTPGAQSVTFGGPELSDDAQGCLYSLARQSTHPLSVRVAEAFAASARFATPVRSFLETPGCGIEGIVAGRKMLMGSGGWLRSRGIHGDAIDHSTVPPESSVVHMAIDGIYRGCLLFATVLRPEVGPLIRRLSGDYKLALLSGDNEKHLQTFAPLFGENKRFNQSPLNKLEFIEQLQHSGQRVMMVGDGLNDAGALEQSNVGVAVVKSISAFSPASDVIMSGSVVPQFDAVLRLAKSSVRIVRVGFVLSALYNVVGIGIAASGLLAPIVCAILMPISSITIVAFSCGATMWAARRSFRDRTNLGASQAKDVEPMLAAQPILSPLT